MMKSGARSRKHRTQRIKSLRPTAGKVKEALFNILRARINNTCFLDLYAGTGAVGLEALKQGASETVFVEAAGRYAKKINTLVKSSGLSGRARIIEKNVISFIEWAGMNNMTFDIIFLDPPYHTDEISNALKAVGVSNILNREGLLIAEHFIKKQLPDESGLLHKVKEYRYGDTILSLYQVS